MRTSLEFNVTGSTHKDLVQEAEKAIKSYLELDEEDLTSHVDVELKVEPHEKEYIAHVHVRIK
jgi:hypothetical protein